MVCDPIKELRVGSVIGGGTVKIQDFGPKKIIVIKVKLIGRL